MNAPVKGWNAHTLATVRMHGQERSTRTAAMVLAALASEKIPHALRPRYEEAAYAAEYLARCAQSFVEARDQSVLGDVAESSEPANDAPPSTERAT